MIPFNSTKTMLAIYNELQSRTPFDYIQPIETTINHKYDVLTSETPSKFPTKVLYYGIGIGGFKVVDDRNSCLPYKVSPKNLDLYQPIPFRCVPVDNDLSDVERAMYRMRVLRTFNNINYWCYILKFYHMCHQISFLSLLIVEQVKKKVLK